MLKAGIEEGAFRALPPAAISGSALPTPVAPRAPPRRRRRSRRERRRPRSRDLRPRPQLRRADPSSRVTSRRVPRSEHSAGVLRCKRGAFALPRCCPVTANPRRCADPASTEGLSIRRSGRSSIARRQRVRAANRREKLERDLVEDGHDVLGLADVPLTARCRACRATL
jgi:hypothetical protein